MDKRTLAAAIPRWIRSGFLITPARTDGGKRPQGPWRAIVDGLQPAPTVETLLRMVDTGQTTGICVHMGACSGFAEMVEVEGRSIHMLPELHRRAEAAGIGQLWQRLLSGCVQRSPSAGQHHLLRVSDGECRGNVKLATGADRLAFAETRGEGGLVIGAPSFGNTHDTGRPWAFVAGGPETVPTFTVEQRDALYAVFRTLDVPKPQPASRPASGSFEPNTSRDAVGRAFDAGTTWPDVLEPLGWRKAGKERVDGLETVIWTRPGRPDGTKSATTGGERDSLLCWSSSAGIDTQGADGKWLGHSRFSVWVRLKHAGDFTKAAGIIHAGLEAGLTYQEIARGRQPLVRIEKPFISQTVGITISFSR